VASILGVATICYRGWTRRNHSWSGQHLNVN
jgi:hypothetical protein